MKYIKTILASLVFSVLTIGMTSCEDGPVFEKEGDCSPKVQFVFKKHRQALHQIEGRETDVFYSTVGSVHLFVIDVETGEVVFEKIEKTENLQSASQLNIGDGKDLCYMPLDLKPGRYKFVAWCGLNETDDNNAFRLVRNEHCEVKREEGQPISSAKFDALYHGVVKEVTIDYNSGHAQIIPVELTKNTNDIHVWVQHTSQTFDKGDYEVVYADANGAMHFEDNSISDANRLEYRPHTTSLLTSDTEYNGNLVQTGALVAHLSTARLMEHNAADARLEVRDKEGKTIFSVPFIKYVLEMQTFVEGSSTKSSSRDYQYYLDCEDTYNCTFYLTGERDTWTPSMIIINNWVRVPDQQVGM